MVAPKGFSNGAQEAIDKFSSVPRSGEERQTPAIKPGELSDQQIAAQAGTDTEVELRAQGEQGKQELREVTEKRLSEPGQFSETLAEQYNTISNNGRGQIILKKERKDANGNTFLSPEKVVVYDLGQVSEAVVTPEELNETMQILEAADTDELALNASRSLETLVPRAFENMEKTYGLSENARREISEQFTKRLTAHTNNQLGLGLNPKTGKPELDIIPGENEITKAVIEGTGLEVAESPEGIDVTEEILGETEPFSEKQQKLIQETAIESGFVPEDTVATLIERDDFFKNIPLEEREARIKEIMRGVKKFGQQSAMIEIQQKIGIFEQQAALAEQTVSDQLFEQELLAIGNDPEKIKAFVESGLSKYSNNIQGFADRLGASVSSVIDKSLTGDKELGQFVSGSARAAIKNGDTKTFRKEIINSLMSKMRDGAGKLGLNPNQVNAAMQRLHNQALGDGLDRHPHFKRLVETTEQLYKNSIGIDDAKTRFQEETEQAADLEDPTKQHRIIDDKMYAFNEEEAALVGSDPQAAIARNKQRIKTEATQSANAARFKNELETGALTVLTPEGEESRIISSIEDPEERIDAIDDWVNTALTDPLNPISRQAQSELIGQANQMKAKLQKEASEKQKLGQEAFLQITSDLFSRPLSVPGERKVLGVGESSSVASRADSKANTGTTEAKSSGSQPPEPREFASEAEAEAAGLKPGDIVIIDGKRLEFF